MKKNILFLSVFLLFINNNAAYSKEFLDTILHINFGMAYGFPYGKVIDREESHRVEDRKPDHYFNSYGVTVDIAPFRPFVLGLNSHAVKLGLRAGFKSNYVEQQIEDNKDSSDTESLFAYRTMMFGPVIHYSPWVGISSISGDYTAQGGFTFYVLYGNLYSGKLTNFPSGTPDSETIESGGKGSVTTGLEGFQIDAGVGGVVSVCSVNLGLNLYYSYVRYRMDTWAYSGLSRTGSLKLYAAEIYIGIPIEWIRVPKIF